MADSETQSQGSDSLSEAEREVTRQEDVPPSWLGYGWYLVRAAGTGVYNSLYYLGEKLAWELGITSPDWQYAIDIHEDMKAEEEEEREEEERALRAQLARLRQLEGQPSGTSHHE